MIFFFVFIINFIYTYINEIEFIQKANYYVYRNGNYRNVIQSYEHIGI